MLIRYRYTGFWMLCSVFLLALLAACAAAPDPSRTPQVQATPSSPVQLTAYLPASLTPSPVQVTATATVPAPTSTPTPRTHVVRQGEDMSGIALLYGINLDELRTANPTVQPYFLSVGAVLIIPGTAEPQTATPPPGQLQTPTALPLQAGALACYRTSDGGAWCFLPVRNQQERALESVSALIRLADASGQEIAAQTAYPPLDLLPPGALLPLSVYFPPPLPAELRGSAEVVRALPYPEDGRYVSSQVTDQKIVLSEDGLSAQINCTVQLLDPAGSAQRVWVAAVAYDAQNTVVGLRRWEHAGQALTGSQPLAAQFWVYSAAGPIARVELLSEARP